MPKGGGGGGPVNQCGYIRARGGGGEEKKKGGGGEGERERVGGGGDTKPNRFFYKHNLQQPRQLFTYTDAQGIPHCR